MFSSGSGFGQPPPFFPPVCSKCGQGWEMDAMGGCSRCHNPYEFPLNPIPLNIFIQRKHDNLQKPPANTESKCIWCLEPTSTWLCCIETGDLITWWCKRCLNDGKCNLEHIARRN